MGIISDNSALHSREVLTGSLFGMPWSPWLFALQFALQDVEVQIDRSAFDGCQPPDGR